VFSIVTAAKAPSGPESFMRILHVILISCFFLASCETIKGVGRDVEDAGETIDDSIDDE
jgi:predicted small secreted protein